MDGLLGFSSYATPHMAVEFAHRFVGLLPGLSGRRRMQESVSRHRWKRAPCRYTAAGFLVLGMLGSRAALAQYGPEQNLEEEEDVPAPVDPSPSPEGAPEGSAPAPEVPPAVAQPAPKPGPQHRPASISPAAAQPLPVIERPSSPTEDLLAAPTLTASRTIQPVAFAPGTVRVVTRREMLKNGWRSVAEVLANTPGFYVTSDGSNTSVAVRGVSGGIQAGTRLLKVMINGTPVNFRPELRAFIGPEYIPIGAIERIEIVQGPLSALYGPNALVATINVITREVPAGTNATVAGAVTGQNENRSGYGGSGLVMYGGEHARVLVAATAYSLDRSRLRIEKTFEAQDPALPRYAPFFADRSDDDFSTPSGLFVQIAVPSTSAGTLTVEGGLQSLDANTEFRINSVLTHQSRESILNTWVNLRHENRWIESISSELNVGYSAGKPTRQDEYQLTGNPAQTYTRNFGYRALTSSAALDITPIPEFSARIGLEADLELQDILFYTVTFAAAQGMRQAGESQDLVGANVDRSPAISNRAAYLSLSGQPLPMFPELRLHGSLRLDSAAYGDVDFPTLFSARAVAVAEWLPWFITKVGVGRGFHTPSAVLMFAQSGFGLSNNLLGNRAPTSGAPPLEAQRLDGLDASVHLALWDAALLDVSVFYQNVTKRIEFALTASDFVARNTGDQTLMGGEAALRTTLGPVNPFGTVAIVQSEEDPLVAYPKFMSSLGVNVALFDTPSLYFQGRVRHIGERAGTTAHATLNGNEGYSLPAYQAVDLSLSIDNLALFGRGANTELLASAQNVLDERHSEPGFVGFDVPALGRTAFFEIRQSF